MKSHFLTSFKCSLAICLMLAGCGASDINMSSPRVSVKGVAATGAPITGTVTLKDSAATPRVLTAGTKAGGSFTVDATNLIAPYVLRVDWSDASGANRMFAVAEGPGTANINPFSNATYAAAADASDSDALAPDQDPAVIKAASEKHGSVMRSLMKKLAPLFALYNTSKDPEHDDYEADHTGLDALFDDVKIVVSHGMIIVTNKKTGGVIFKASVNNIDAGTFYPENMPGNPGGTGTIDGATLYANNCSSCHGALASSSKQGRTAAQIQSAIKSVSAMGGITLTAAEIQAIASVLGATTPPPPATDGAALYASNCSSCHGALATSSKQGRTATQIQSAIGSVGAMSALSNLTAAQVLAIASALTTATPPPAACTYTYATWGACQSNNTQSRNLLTSTPAGCTGTPVLTQSCTYVPPSPSACTYTYDAWGACQSNNTQTRNLLTSTPTGCTGTPALSQSCTYVPPVIDGAALYAGNCSSCHGALATSSKQGRTAAQIQSAINGNTGGMGSLSSLSTAQVQAIATALAITTPPPPVIDGAALYASNCSGCHGAIATTSKRGRTAAQIQSAISSNRGGMGSLSSLTTAQIQAIATAIK